MGRRKYRVVEIVGQGYGYMSPKTFDRTPNWARAKVRVLQYCDTEQEAQQAAKELPGVWHREIRARVPRRPPARELPQPRLSRRERARAARNNRAAEARQRAKGGGRQEPAEGIPDFDW